MKNSLLITALFLLSLPTFAQRKKGADFDMKDFNEKFDVVLWLDEYDKIAWGTSDSVMTQPQDELRKLGPEWFCFKDDAGLWHAVYGRLDNDHYDLVFHYTVDDQNKVKRSKEGVGQEFLDPFALALNTANQNLQELRDSVGIRFNQFIRKNPDKTFDVWIFPAFQPDGTAVYGGEFHFKLNPSGKTILAKDSYYQGAFRGFKTQPSREIWLDYQDVKQPTLGSIFFAWYYRQYFTSIKIDNETTFTTPFKDDNRYSWVHVQKDMKKRVKQKR